MKMIYLNEGMRIFSRSLRARLRGFRNYKGNARQICSQIVSECFNGTYFQASGGHFCQFYTRDFGWCTDSLLKLGYREEIIKTLSYALDIFSRHEKITTSITPSGIPFDFPSYAPDSLAFLIRSLRAADAKILIEKYAAFLGREIKKFFDIVIDKDTGLVRKDRHFSSMKDHSLRESSCYDNVMAAMLAKEIENIGIFENPFKGYSFKKTIKDNFWNGSYFLEDLSGNHYITGDSNVFPFWCSIFSSRKMLKSSISSMQEACLDKPFPLRYSSGPRLAKQKFIALEFFAKNYERDTVWTHMGPLYISLVKKISKDDFSTYCQQYKKLIEEHKNYLEIFTPKGKPYHTPFYYSDESMLWAALFLTL